MEVEELLISQDADVIGLISLSDYLKLENSGTLTNYFILFSVAHKPRLASLWAGFGVLCNWSLIRTTHNFILRQPWHPRVALDCQCPS